MAAILRSVISSGVLAPAGVATIAHGLVNDAGTGLIPHTILPTSASPIVVTGKTTAGVSFRNDGSANETASFLCLYEHSFQAPASTASADWAGGATSLPTASLGGAGVIANVTKAAAAAGTSALIARADHKHDVTTAIADGLDSASTSAEGAATSLARSDHAHRLNNLDGRSMAVGAALVGGGALAAIPVPMALVADIADGPTATYDFTLPWSVEVLDAIIIKNAAAGGAGDTVRVQAWDGGAAANITNAMSINVAASTRVAPTTIDSAESLVPFGESIRLDVVDGGAANTGFRAIIRVIRR